MNSYGHLINYIYRRYARSSNVFADVRKCIQADRGMNLTEHSSIIRFLLTVLFSWTGKLDIVSIASMIVLSSDQAALEFLLGEMSQVPVENLKRSGIKIVEPDPKVLPILQPEMEFLNAANHSEGQVNGSAGDVAVLGDREKQEEVPQGSAAQTV